MPRGEGVAIEVARLIITGWLTRLSTRNMKTARASRENGFDSVPEDVRGESRSINQKGNALEQRHIQSTMEKVVTIEST